jgi:hypothetical protein
MADEFYFLVETPSGKRIAVNPSQVRYISDLDGKQSMIVFDSDVSVVVTDKLEAVVAKLRGIP